MGLKTVGVIESLYGWRILLEAHGGSRVPRALLCPLLNAICFAFVPQRYPVKARVQAEPPTCWGAHVLFADAAPVGVGPDNFCVGLFLPLGGVRMLECPCWVTTLQVAELWGRVQGVRLATYMKWPRVCVGSDNTVARCHMRGKDVLSVAQASSGNCGPCSSCAVGLGFPLRVFMYLLTVTQRMRLAECTNLTR